MGVLLPEAGDGDEEGLSEKHLVGYVSLGVNE